MTGAPVEQEEKEGGAAPTSDLKAPTFSHRLEYAAVRAAVGVLDTMSWRRASDIGARLGALAYQPFGIRADVVEKQVAAAFPAIGDKEVRRIALGAYENLGRTSIETALLHRYDARGIVGLFSGADNWELVERSLAKGRGIIFVTGHLGNWEIAGAYVAARGVPVEAIARRMGNPLFDAYVQRTRAGTGMRIVHDADAVRRTPRALREGHGVAFLFDQGVLGLASTFVPFFGRPAKTPRGPAVFALRLRVPVIFAATVREPDGRFRIAFEEVSVPETGDRERDIDAIVAEYSRLLENWVRRVPEQYFWHHRRWRRQPPDTPDALRDPTR